MCVSANPISSRFVLCTNTRPAQYTRPERIHVEQDRQIIMIARWQAAVGSSSHPPTPLHKTLWPPSLKAERASMSVHRPCSLRGVPKTRVHHLFVAWTPVICFLRAPRRLMRSDWPFNFPFINSVGWRLYIEVFVSQRFHERARQLCNETQCPWI